MTAPIALLYIDDDTALARLVQRALRRRGFSVECAATVAEGLSRLSRGGIDVIALDHFLDVGTGLDFLGKLRTFPDAPPVVYVTGSAETAVAVAALKAGATDYVPKSVGDEFIELLASGLSQAVEKARLEHARDRAERDLRQAKDRAEALLREVNHRVANSLSLVTAMVRMQTNAINDAGARHALGEIQARVMAIAGVHRRLYTTEDVRSVEIAGYLKGLLSELEQTMPVAEGRPPLRLRAETHHVPTDHAVSIGVVVAELVSNALKYAYPTGKPGDIEVTFDSSEGVSSLSVEDWGVGFTGVEVPKGTGVGSRIIAAMAQNLSATITYGGPPGCRVTLRFGAHIIK